ncbi:hypothetical protein EXVG_00058 [Emiliania huxleyi virus 202]|nr:hypothetical protein EXVG_00058 [Emiliania huxleyi virus 202]AHA55533.1 hypothetical protein EhV156_00438 [Emiliania huxleyi virus 156]
MAIGDTVGPNYDNIARVKRMEENKKPEKNKKNKKNKSPAQPKANPVGTNLPESSRVQESMGKPTVVEEVPTKKGYVSSTMYAVGAPVRGTRYVVKKMM